MSYQEISLYTFLLWLFLSFKIVGPKEQGLLILFGKPVLNLSSGLKIVPFLLCKIIIETRNNIQDELPTEPEKIWRGDGTMEEELVARGYKPPIRIQFGPASDKPEYRDDPYNRPMSVEVVPVITWKIYDLKTFVQQVGTVEEARKQMQDTVIAKFTIDFANDSPAVVRRNLQMHSENLQKSIEKITQSWGVEIISAQIKPFVFNHSLNKSVTDVAEASQKALKTVIDAEANAKKIVTEGEATATAELKMLKAKAEGIKLAAECRAIGLSKLAELSGTPEGQIALQLDTLTRGLEGSKHTFVPLGDLFGAITNLKAVIDSTKGRF